MNAPLEQSEKRACLRFMRLQCGRIMLSSPDSSFVVKFMYDPHRQIWLRMGRQKPDKLYKSAITVKVVIKSEHVLINEIDEYKKCHSAEIVNWCADNLLGAVSVQHVSTNVRGGLLLEQYFLIYFELEEDAMLVYLAYKG